MKRWLKGIVLFTCMFAVFLLAMFPAATAYRIFRDNMMPANLYQVNGSIWKGSARLLTIHQYQFKELKWDIEPMKMLLGKLAARFTVKDPQYPLQGSISASMGSTMTISALKGMLPAALVPALARQPDFNLKGDLEIDLDSMKLDDKIPRSARGRITLKNATINLPGKITIGNIRADIETRGNDINVRLQDLGAPIGLNGTITLKGDHTYTGTLLFTPTSQSDSGVINLLRNTGNTLQNGSIELRFNGKL